mgnify:CR=1 FL=1
MDLQRSLLIGAIAVLSFMLLTEWVAFKDEKTAAAETKSSRLITNEASPAATPADMPDLPTGDSQQKRGHRMEHQ